MKVIQNGSNLAKMSYERESLIHNNNNNIVNIYGERNYGSIRNNSTSEGSSVKNNESSNQVTNEDNILDEDFRTLSVEILDSVVFLNNQSPILKVFKRRWYILILFCLINFAQNLVWNTWNPIVDSAKIAFKWSEHMLALFSFWANLTFLSTAFFFSLLLDRKGLRWASLISITLVTVGAGLRCISMNEFHVTWLVNLGQILNGFAGPVLMSGCPMLSSIWFPANERITSTSLISFFGGLGVAFAFIIGPIMVPNVHNTSNFTEQYFIANKIAEDEPFIKHIKWQINQLMLLEFTICIVIWLAVLIYFPAKPSIPPTVSASIAREPFKSGLQKLMKNKSFWIVFCTYSLSVGICDVWSSFLVLFTRDFLTQMESGWLGFYALLGSSIAGCIFARFSDIFPRHMKSSSLVILFISLGCLILFTLFCFRVIVPSKAYLFISFSIVVVCLEGWVPLFYEMGCETGFPVNEGLSNGVLTWGNNFVGIILLSALMIPFESNYQWMNIVACGTLTLSIFLLFFYRENYQRLSYDETNWTLKQ